MAAADIIARLAHDRSERRTELARTYVRSLIASEFSDADRAYASNRWGQAVAAEIQKAAVGAISTIDLGDAAQAFFGLVMENSLLGRVGGLRRTPFGARTITPTGGATGFWVAEGKSTPLSKQTVLGSTLRPLRVSAITCFTKEALANPVAEAGLQSDLLRALTGAMDWAFVDPSNAGAADEIPASIAYGQTQIPSVGGDADSVREDFRALTDAFQGDWSSACLLMNPRTAVRLGLLQSALAQHDLRVADGGSLFGLPVYCSSAVPIDSTGTSITLLDASAIAYDATGFIVTPSGQATLEMSDTPTNASDTPTATQLVSLWQTNTIAWRADVQANWKVHGTGRVVTLTGVDYSNGVSP